MSYENSLVVLMFLHCFLTRITSISPGHFFFHNPHWPLEQLILHRHLIILRIYWVAASVSATTSTNFFDFIAQYHSIAWRLLPSFYCITRKNVWKLCYLKADFGVPGLMKDFAVVTFQIGYLQCRKLREWLVSPLKIIFL